jgi:hypothetical protein
MRARIFWIVACIGASGGCTDESFNLSVCPSSLNPPLHMPIYITAQVDAAEGETINMELEGVPSGLSAEIDSNQGSHFRTVTVTCESAGKYTFKVRAGHPMDFLSNSQVVSVDCPAEGGTVPNYEGCYGDYHPPS